MVPKSDGAEMDMGKGVLNGIKPTGDIDWEMFPVMNKHLSNPGSFMMSLWVPGIGLKRYY